MEWILLLGSIFNIVGGIGLLVSVVIKFPYGFPEISSPNEIIPRDYMQYRLFTAGTAFTFGALYFYLYRNPEYAVPFLLFGMFLKYWAFISSLIARYRYDLPMDVFISFGCSNVCVGVLFSIYLLAG